MDDHPLCVLCPHVAPNDGPEFALPPEEIFVFEPGLAIFARYFNVAIPSQLCENCCDRVNEYKCACGGVVGHSPEDPDYRSLLEVLPHRRQCICGQRICDDCTVRNQTGEDFAIFLENPDLELDDPICIRCMYIALAASATRGRYTNFRNGYFSIVLGCGHNIVHTLWKLAWPKDVVIDRVNGKEDRAISYFSTTLNRMFDPPVDWRLLY